MKKYLLVFVAICATNFSAMAQLTVSSSGNVTMSKRVGINGATPVDSIGLAVSLPHPLYGRDYGIYVNHYHQPNLYNDGCHVSIFGQVSFLPPISSGIRETSFVGTPFRAGVAGLATTGCAIYGGCQAALPNTWIFGNLAGFFNGNVRVSGNLTANSITNLSDMRLKNNIINIDESAIQVLSSLRPVSYTFSCHDSLIYLEKGDENRLRYGLVAQEVQDILPNIVYEDGAGYLSINYIELIPFLIQAINQQQAQIEELQDALDVANQNDSRRNVRANAMSVPKLYQNSPNPFNKITTIGYDLPLDTHEASIHIYDLNGTEFVAFSIDTFGRGELTIDGGTLHAGMYLYSLIADGKLIDTKQMILTK